MQPQDIQTLLSEALTLDEVYVTGDGSHFQVIAVSDVFADMSRVKQQQYIYGPLMDKIASNEIHALQIKALTKAQWAREKIFLKPA